jgi:hypothetical protein
VDSVGAGENGDIGPIVDDDLRPLRPCGRNDLPRERQERTRLELLRAQLKEADAGVEERAREIERLVAAHARQLDVQDRVKPGKVLTIGADGWS